MTVFLARPEPIGIGVRLAVKDLFDTAGNRSAVRRITFRVLGG